ncbi:MAG: hypothetical protein WA228_07210 [Desulfobaccales bacterium]
MSIPKTGGAGPAAVRELTATATLRRKGRPSTAAPPQGRIIPGLRPEAA